MGLSLPIFSGPVIGIKTLTTTIFFKAGKITANPAAISFIGVNHDHLVFFLLQNSVNAFDLFGT